MIVNLMDWFLSVIGGVFIGISSGLLFMANGRIAGISGMVSSLIVPWNADTLEKALFLLGLPLGAMFYVLLGGDLPITLMASPVTLLVAGFLVGIGTRLSNGCTSGHGVCGIARLSPNSIVATGLFILSAILTVALGRLL